MIKALDAAINGQRSIKWAAENYKVLPNCRESHLWKSISLFKESEPVQFDMEASEIGYRKTKKQMV